jgi:hypothetical protein
MAWVGTIKPRIILQSTDASRLDDPRWASVSAQRWLVTARDGWIWASARRDGTITTATMRETLGAR